MYYRVPLTNSDCAPVQPPITLHANLLQLLNTHFQLINTHIKATLTTMKFINAIVLLVFVPNVTGKTENGMQCEDLGVFTTEDCSAECQKRTNGMRSMWKAHCGVDGKVTLCECSSYTTGYNPEVIPEVDGLPAGIFTCTSEEPVMTNTTEVASTSKDEQPAMINTTASDEPVIASTTEEPSMINTIEEVFTSEDDESIVVNTTEELSIVNSTEVVSTTEEPSMINTIVNTTEELSMVNSTEVVSASEDNETMVVNTTCKDLGIFTTEDCSAECKGLANGMGSKWNAQCNADGTVTLCECAYTTSEVDGFFGCTNEEPATIYTAEDEESALVNTTEEPSMVNSTAEVVSTSEVEEPVMVVNTTNAAEFGVCKDFGIFTSDDCSAECKNLANGMGSNWTIHYDCDGEITLCDCTYATGYNPAEVGYFTCTSKEPTISNTFEEPAFVNTTQELIQVNTTEVEETALLNANGGAAFGDCENDFGIFTSEDCSAECQKRSNGMGSKWNIRNDCDGKLTLCECTYTMGNLEVDGLPAEGCFTCTSKEPVVNITEACPDSINTFAQCKAHCKSLSSNFYVSFKGRSEDELSQCTCNYGQNLQSSYTCTREGV